MIMRRGHFDFEVGNRVWETLTIDAESGFLINAPELPGEAGWTADAEWYQVPLLANVTFHLKPARGFTRSWGPVWEASARR